MMSSRAKLRVDVGFRIGTVLLPLLIKVFIWDPCPSGLPEMLTVADMVVAKKERSWFICLGPGTSFRLLPPSREDAPLVLFWPRGYIS